MKIIVISDIHLGIDDRIAENVKNKPLLISFLKKIQNEKLADEVVINGDFLDQWFLPGNYKTNPDSDAFYKEVAENNRDVIDEFQSLNDSGIRLVYVPGNHDMTLSHRTLEDILPGIVQSRDVRGLGRYRTGRRGEIVVEHSHRYDLFCAPDILTNREFMEYGEPILPAGYFFARVGVTSFAEGMPEVEKEIKEISMPSSDDDDQLAAYAYFKVWENVLLNMFPVNESFDEEFINVAVDGFRGSFSINDLIPKEHDDGIYAKLYRNVQRNWAEVQRRNFVPCPNTPVECLKNLLNKDYYIDYSRRQYFDLDPTVDVVVFGHTHLPAYRVYDGYDRPKVVVNEGTWIDKNTDDLENTATFTLIDSGAEKTEVELLKYVDGEFVEVKNEYVES
ncbi:metallophosphoesterase [Methanobrevibacter sp.]|uniref:metallophosphoesterase n=1 Tax=Methanobrevibacter sp. TaxID=66852 RepID=UPI00388EB350